MPSTREDWELGLVTKDIKTVEASSMTPQRWCAQQIISAAHSVTTDIVRFLSLNEEVFGKHQAQNGCAGATASTTAS